MPTLEDDGNQFLAPKLSPLPPAKGPKKLEAQPEKQEVREKMAPHKCLGFIKKPEMSNNSHQRCRRSTNKCSTTFTPAPIPRFIRTIMAILMHRPYLFYFEERGIDYFYFEERGIDIRERGIIMFLPWLPTREE